MNGYNDIIGTDGSPLAFEPVSTREGSVAAELSASMLRESHQRSASFGLTADTVPDFSPAGRAEMSLLLEKNQVLHTHALPVMETLYEQIVNTHNMVVLTDPHGVIVHAMGDADFLEKANRVALTNGVSWSERGKGTNAIGTAIAAQQPVLVHADQHFLRANHFLTCSAAPILDHRGQVIGVLDVTGDQRSYHQHTMALVRMSAQMIENQVFAAAFDDAITLHFHARPEFIGTLMEGIASFTPGGRFLSASRAGLFQLGLPVAALQSHTFSSLFGLPVSALFDHYRTTAPTLLDMCLHNGVRVYARAEMRRSNMVFQNAHEGFSGAGTAVGTNTTAAASARSAGGPVMNNRPDTVRGHTGDAARRSPARLSSLRYLNTGDAQLARVIDKVNKVIGHDISILITGETGTGKELLAQAIHNDSPRADGPFGAVNCASIPESLIESELFGYEDGAFTGARKKGSVGKILQANGGTLFLDEIGDMPLPLQARLLRVLQERVVTPLGSTKSIPVNVTLICATNRNLRELIAQHGFREDLYYRLNGLVVKLPPLRERSDLEVVITKLLATEAGGQAYRVSPEAMQLFKQHKWPGNFRQLTNLLRTALVMVGAEREIRPEHLPDDFLEDVSGVMLAQMPELGIAASAALRTALATTSAAGGVESAGGESTMLDEAQTAIIRKSLAAHKGNVSATARALGISRNTIYRKIAG